jgi:carbonic anhydrase
MSKDCKRPSRAKPEEVIKRLEAGYQRFLKGKSCPCPGSGTPEADKRCNCKELSQTPYAIVLSCSDSRVVPEQIFCTGANELFVVRVAGNIANDATLATIEYGVQVLCIKTIVVLGHFDCGAVKEAINIIYDPFQDEYKPPSRYLRSLLAQVQPAVLKEGKGDPKEKAYLNRVIRQNARFQAGQIHRYSPATIDAGEVQVYFGVFRPGHKQLKFTRWRRMT